jgi:uncharacterized protein (TIGR02001 family)
MRKTAIILVAAVMACVAAYAADVEVDIGMYSQYMWRGMNLDNRPVVQGGVTVSSTNGFYANVWGNYATSDDFVGEDYNGLNEVDYTVGYAGTYDIFDYDVGYIYYSFPNTDYVSSQEIYAGVALNNLVVTPSLYVYYDFQEVDGFYAIADVNYGKDLSEELSMELGASLGFGDSNYHDFWYGKDAAGISDMSLYAGLSYALSDSLSLNASLTYTFFPDGALADAAEDAYAQDQNIWGGVSLAYSF